jgi:hypothetical protein
MEVGASAASSVDPPTDLACSYGCTRSTWDGAWGPREEDPVTTFWTIVVYAYVVVALVFVGIGVWWMRPHH